MPASRTLSHNSPAKNRPTSQAAVPQARTQDPRHARRNALADGTPTAIAPRSEDRQDADAPRNAVDGAVPSTSLPSVKFLLQQVPAPPTGRMRGLPACFPCLRPEAPSFRPDHPYAVLGLSLVGSGNYLPAPPRLECAECQMDLYIAHFHKQHLGRGCEPVVPAVESQAPKTGEVSLTFAYKGVWAQGRGVLVSDILGFRSNIAQAGQKFIRAGAPGPMIVTFQIEGLGTVQDIIYGNCKHRSITHFNLAVALSYAFYSLAFTHGADPKDLALMTLKSAKNCTEWVARARFVHR
ncbi:hypothetical protein B0H12DRAFT_1241220 [Mycena haematopus]|nr:hypothetical protein B0H12DRAFT_1241220 [Mycena haematopus]